MQRCVAALRISTASSGYAPDSTRTIAALLSSAEDFNLSELEKADPRFPGAALLSSAEDFNAIGAGGGGMPQGGAALLSSAEDFNEHFTGTGSR